MNKGYEIQVSRAPDGQIIFTRDANVPQAIHLVGMESPGLTAAPAVAEHVAKMAAEILG